MEVRPVHAAKPRRKSIAPRSGREGALGAWYHLGQAEKAPCVRGSIRRKSAASKVRPRRRFGHAAAPERGSYCSGLGSVRKDSTKEDNAATKAENAAAGQAS